MTRGEFTDRFWRLVADTATSDFPDEDTDDLTDELTDTVAVTLLAIGMIEKRGKLAVWRAWRDTVEAFVDEHGLGLEPENN
jgi:hypothetical protein